jgi:hypothetical protein
LQAIENDALATHLLSADKKLFNSRISPAAAHEAGFRATADGALTNPSWRRPRCQTFVLAEGECGLLQTAKLIGGRILDVGL